MPIYEYYCSQHGKFDKRKGMEERKSNPCPKCNQRCNLVPSMFSWKLFNPFTKDGPGFTSKYVQDEELAEMNQECKER